MTLADPFAGPAPLIHYYSLYYDTYALVQKPPALSTICNVQSALNATLARLNTLVRLHPNKTHHLLSTTQFHLLHIHLFKINISTHPTHLKQTAQIYKSVAADHRSTPPTHRLYAHHFESQTCNNLYFQNHHQYRILLARSSFLCPNHQLRPEPSASASPWSRKKRRNAPLTPFQFSYWPY